MPLHRWALQVPKGSLCQKMKNPLVHWGVGPAPVLFLASWSDTLPAELFHPTKIWCIVLFKHLHNLWHAIMCIYLFMCCVRVFVCMSGHCATLSSFKEQRHFSFSKHFTDQHRPLPLACVWFMYVLCALCVWCVCVWYVVWFIYVLCVCVCMVCLCVLHAVFMFEQYCKLNW